MLNKLNEQNLAKWKKAFTKSGIKFKTDLEYREAIHNLLGYFELLIELDQQQNNEQKIY